MINLKALNRQSILDRTFQIEGVHFRGLVGSSRSERCNPNPQISRQVHAPGKTPSVSVSTIWPIMVFTKPASGGWGLMPLSSLVRGHCTRPII